MQEFKVRTDLAVELKEDVAAHSYPENGVSFQEDYIYDGRIKVTKVIIENSAGEELTGKPVGKYITGYGFSQGHIRKDCGIYQGTASKKKKMPGIGGRTGKPDGNAGCIGTCSGG